jgi:hypothetical protein
MEYDQRIIIRFLLNEGIDVHDIADRLQAQFCEHTYTLRTARFWIAEVRLGHQDFHDEIRSGRSPLDDLDAKILVMLDRSSFESACSTAETLPIVYSTVLLHLHNSIDLRSFHGHRMPHLLTHHLREKRKEYAKTILLSLHATECDSWHHPVTSDES